MSLFFKKFFSYYICETELMDEMEEFDEKLFN
jgi:hypothetical protein